MTFRPLFVTGMFRSGTTLLARMLNAHHEIALASDPFLPFLKHLRDELAGELFGPRRVSAQAPLDDYFASADGLALRRAVEAASLDRLLSQADRPRLWPIVRTYAEPFSQNFAARLDEVHGTTYREAYANMLALVGRVYGRGSERVVGHKEVWAGEFTPVLHRAFPEMKCIHVVRDPRAVCASKNIAADRYPWLFLVRQWRKLASLAWMAANGRSLLVRYEDLVGDPEATARRICAFLGLQFDPAMLAPENLRDGDERPWQRNSSYADLSSERAISGQGSDRWRRVLSESEVAFIERLTFPLMQLFGYEPITPLKADVPDAMLCCPPAVSAEQLTEWIRPHVRVDEVSTAAEMGKELLRMRLLKTSEAAGEDAIDSLFYSRMLYEACRGEVGGSGSVRSRRPQRQRAARLMPAVVRE